MLGLLERAQERQRGEKGEPGVGIDRIDQFDDSSFTIKLTTGESKKIALPIAKDGEVGATGSVGPRGPEGPAGQPGRDGKSATDGATGAQGPPGVSIATAVVNDSGELLLQLTDGKISNLGNVRGPAGATGGAGPAGLPGDPGRDGKQMLSGPRAPSQDDGSEGDHWIDLSDTSFALFKKDGGGWNKIADLRQIVQPRAVSTPGGGGGGGVGGGKAELQTTRTLPLINGGSTIRKKAQAKGLPPVPGSMDTQEDANLYFLEAIKSGNVSVSEATPRPPYSEGQLWFCSAPDDLTLYIYDGVDWIPAAPPVSLDGIESSITGIEGELIELHNNVRQVRGDIVLTNQDLNFAVEETKKDQARQDEKLAELDGEIDDLRPSIERGEWIYNNDPDESAVPASGEYHAQVEITDEYCKQKLGECLLNAAGDAAAASQCNRENEDCDSRIGEIDSDVPWHEVTWLVLSKFDQSGQVHSFGDVVPEMYIEAINTDGSGHGLYQINGKSISGKKCALFVSPVHSTGHPNGKAVVKIFKMVDADPSDYVKKTGDTIDGMLTISRTRDDKNENSFRIRGRINGVEDKNLLKDYQRALKDADKSDYIEYFGSCDSDDSIANKKQIQSMIEKQLAAPASLCWEYKKPSKDGIGPGTGYFYLCTTGYYRFSFKTNNGINLAAANSYPTDKNWSASSGSKFELTIWQKGPDGEWLFIKHVEASSTRWGYKAPEGGSKHFEFKNSWESHDRELVSGNIYYVTAGGFF